MGPFIIVVESKDKNLANLHPTSLGKMLFRNKINMNAIKKINRRGRNRLAIELNSAKSANEFLVNETMNQEYNLFIPQRLLTCRGIIRRVGNDISEQDILEYGNVESGIAKIRIIEVRRLKRKIHLERHPQ